MGRVDFQSINLTKTSRWNKNKIISEKDAKEFAAPDKIKTLIKKYSDHISFPINIKEADGEIEQVNSATAIWTKSASQISTEEYKSFTIQPLGLLTNRLQRCTINRGYFRIYEFTIHPQTAPFDLFDPEEKQRSTFI